MRILDLGCGSGQALVSFRITAADQVIGLDPDAGALAAAKLQFPTRAYVRGIGERLPFANERFDRVISNVALPYMNIQKALAEVLRVLVPGGGLSLTLHHPSFTMTELLNRAFPRPLPTLFRLYVLANGFVFHCTGRTFGFVNRRIESFQTQRGMRLALRRAGFINPSFHKQPGTAGVRFFVEAKKPIMQPLVASRAARPKSGPESPEDRCQIQAARSLDKRNVAIRELFYFAGTA